MPENKPTTAPAFADDTPDDEIPDLSTPEWREKFDSVPVARGRPRISNPKVSTTIRLDADVIEKFKATGPGWQSRINEVLKRAKL